MASTLTGGTATAIHMHQAFFGAAPTATQLATYNTQATTDASGFASSMAAAFVNVGSKALALQVLTNLNVTPATVTTTGSYATLLAALEQMFDGYGLSARGQIILNATNLLAGLEADSTYGNAAKGYNTQATAFHAQSTGTAASSGGTSAVTSKGKLVDGYVSGATVFADANNNGKLDAGEASTTTDAKGNFSLSGGSGPLVGFGGTDLSTNKAFKGILKAPVGSTMINPLTSLQQSFVAKGLSVADAEAKVAKALGLGDASTFDLTTYDPLAAALGGGADVALGAKLQAAAVKLANFMVAAGETLIGAAGGATKLDASTAGDALLAAMVKAIDADADGVVSLSDKTMLKNIMHDAALDSGDADLTAKASAVDTMSIAFADMSAAAADNVDAAVTAGGDLNAMMAKLAQSAVVAQGDMADKLLAAAGTGDLTGIDQDYMGAAFDVAASGATVGDLDPNSMTDDAATAASNTAMPLALVSATVNGHVLVLTYNKALDATHIPVTANFTVSGGNTVTNVVVDATAKTVTLTLGTAVLSTDTVTVTYAAPTADSATTNAATQDAAGNDAAAFSAHTVTNHTAVVVVDMTEPTLSSSTPADGAAAVAIGTNIVLTFSEAVAAGTGDIIITDGAADTRTIAVGDTSQVTISGSTVTINPTADLSAGTAYNVQFAAGVITDTAPAHNAFAGITNATTLNFDTAAAPVKAAPTLTGVPTTATAVSTGVATVLVDFTVADADSSNLTVTLTETGGTLAGLTDADTATAGIQLTGTAAAINTALAAATFSVTAAGAASIGISVSDGVAAPVTGTYSFTAAATNAALIAGFVPRVTAVTVTSSMVGTLELHDANGLIAVVAMFVVDSWWASFTVTAQDVMVNGTLKVFDTAGNVATATQSVVLGTNRDNTITGTANRDFIYGFDGNDTINGGDGNDALTGGAGDDTMTGGAGSDLFYVDEGSDLITDFASDDSCIVSQDATLYFRDISTFMGMWGAVRNEGLVWLFSASAGSTISMASAKTGVFSLFRLEGSDGVDILTGSEVRDVINGGNGDDIITGGAGNDSITGDAGNDVITGGVGTDTINVGTGTDTIKVSTTGEAFADVAIELGATLLTSIDQVAGMAAGDKIDLSGISATFTGTVNITNAGATGNTVSLVRGDFAGAVFNINETGTDTLLVYDADGAGAGTAVEAILLVGSAGLGATVAGGVITLT